MKTALAFSGGKDSWACLWLNIDRLNLITVIWVNTGKNYPELLATVEKARALCPNFVELVVDRDGQNAHHGLPADVVPVNWTRQGQEFTESKSVTVQPYTLCCFENIGANLHRFCKEQGFTHLIRGQRSDETHKSTARNGSVVDGIEYVQPIENWTEEQVLDFVAKRMPLPDHFQFKHSSMDCYDCTAYVKESGDRISYMKRHHPGLYSQYEARKQALNIAIHLALET